jgi:hypothetical protein
MPPDAILDIRPRTTGDILDDAWRLYVAHGPRLLLLLTLFQVPAFCAILLLVTYTPADSPSMADHVWRLALAAACASLLPLTGIGSGACQEFLRGQAEGKPTKLRSCLRMALRNGVAHSTARAVMCLGGFVGLLLLLVPAGAIWIYGATVHALLADDKVPVRQRWSQLGREAMFDSAKAAGIVLSRVPLYLFAVVNLHIVVHLVLWVASNLAGFDISVLEVQLSVFSRSANPVYLLTLCLLAWLLLSPFFEASNFLLYLDTRVRREGLDILYQVQRLFALPERRKSVMGAVASALVGVVAGLCLLTSSAYADQPNPDGRLVAVRAARKDVSRIAEEVRVANPYTDGELVQGRLERVRMRLEQAFDRGGDQLAWFATAIADFGTRDQKMALGILANLQSQLALLEDSLTPRESGVANQRTRLSKDDVKNLLRKRSYEEAKSSTEKEDPHQDEIKEVEVKQEGGGNSSGGASGGMSGPAIGGAGLGEAGWMILFGMFLAVLVAGLVLLGIYLYKNRTRKPKEARVATEELTETNEPSLTEQPVAVLWQQAEKLAADGRYLDALRALYRAVLSLLHRRQMLRYESTRTNGEYVQEVRLSPTAPAPLREPFEHLTDLFERKWYGDRDCQADDFRNGLGLAEEIQKVIR